MTEQFGQSAAWRSKLARSLSVNAPSSASVSRASHSSQRIGRGFNSNGVRSGISNHLFLITFEKPRQFRTTPANARFHCTFRYVKHLRNFLVVQILQVAKNHGLPQFWRDFG